MFCFLWFLIVFRKQRFYLYSRRMPSDSQNVDRDVFNEKPSKEDIIAVPEGQGKFNAYGIKIIRNRINTNLH